MLNENQKIAWQEFENAHYNSLKKFEEYKKEESKKELELLVKKNEALKIKAAYALNMCMVSLSQIVDYNDINILRQEYDAILNNLNIENIIKDEAMLDALKKILDTCHFYILHEKDKEIQKKKQAARLKGALGKALGGNKIFAVFGGTPNPWAMVAAAGVLVGSSIISYKSEKSKAEIENEAEEWELEKTALEQLHNLRRTLFETAWRLSDAYNFPDEYRLTEKQISLYNEILRDNDPVNRFERLKLIDDNFQAYPLFWYYLGRAALEASDLYRSLNPKEKEYRNFPRVASESIQNYYRSEAKTALDKFKDIHSENQLLREDIIAASAYLDLSEFYLDDSPMECKSCIDKAVKIAGLDFEIIQICAFRYVQLAEKIKDENNIKECLNKAIKYLRLLLNENYNPELNGRALSKIYIDNNKKTEYDLLRECIEVKTPFVYGSLLPWDSVSYKVDLDMYFTGNQFFNTIGQYLEGRVRCIFGEFYHAIYIAKRDLDNSALEDFKKNNNLAELTEELSKRIFMEHSTTYRSQVREISDLIGKYDSKENSESKELLKTYGKHMQDFINDSRTTEGRWYTLWIKDHSIDFDQSSFDLDLKKTDTMLYKFVQSQAQKVLLKLKEKAIEYDRLNQRHKEYTKNNPPKSSDEYIFELVTFMSSESNRMRNIIQEFTVNKLKYNNYISQKKTNVIPGNIGAVIEAVLKNKKS